MDEAPTFAASLEERVERLEKTVRTLAWWLVEAQTGFGVKDAQALVRILEGKS